VTVVDVDQYRRFFAEELQAVCRLASPALVEAFARVPRERFLGHGPWQIPSLEMLDPRGVGYQQTVDGDPRRIYHNVAVAIDPARQLNNGHPGTLATWLDWLSLREGDRVTHIGCGTGYYTAIIAETVGPRGQVQAIETDPDLAVRARANLEPWPQVRVVHGDGSEIAHPMDGIFVNAGVTHPLDSWLDALPDGGRMLLPITVSFGPATTLGKGGAVRIERRGDRYAARWGSFLMIYNCSIARDPEMNQRIGQAFGSGAITQGPKLQSLRRDPHTPDETCWLHRDGACLSQAGI
jgi:protein-L-isoaspartate(D-aspartate) O-methyltransferase